MVFKIIKRLFFALLIATTIPSHQAFSKEVQYLFNSKGEWIAFSDGKYVFDKEAKWVGWLAWEDNDVANTKGKYLGTIVSNNRLVYFENHPYRGYPGYPGYSGYPGYPGYPGYAGYSTLPSGADDVILPSSNEE